MCRAVSQAFCAFFLELLRLKHEPLGADSYGKHSLLIRCHPLNQWNKDVPLEMFPSLGVESNTRLFSREKHLLKWQLA